MTLKVDEIQNTSGGAVTLTKQSAAKAWFSMNEATPVFLDSFNFSSITDHSTGNKTVSFSSNLANTSYSVSGSNSNDGTNYTRGTGGFYDNTVSTSSYRYVSCGGSSSTSNGYQRDDLRMKQMYTGDLA